jgi:hypothetical protein
MLKMLGRFNVGQNSISSSEHRMKPLGSVTVLEVLDELYNVLLL